jgi:hypothetical protein
VATLEAKQICSSRYPAQIYLCDWMSRNYTSRIESAVVQCLRLFVAHRLNGGTKRQNIPPNIFTEQVIFETNITEHI